MVRGEYPPVSPEELKFEAEAKAINSVLEEYKLPDEVRQVLHLAIEKGWWKKNNNKFLKTDLLDFLKEEDLGFVADDLAKHLFDKNKKGVEQAGFTSQRKTVEENLGKGRSKNVEEQESQDMGVQAELFKGMLEQVLVHMEGNVEEMGRRSREAIPTDDELDDALDILG